MVQPISLSHSFIVRIWLEKREINNLVPMWRGVIEHVPSGKKLYFKKSEEIIRFIQIFIDETKEQVG